MWAAHFPGSQTGFYSPNKRNTHLRSIHGVSRTTHNDDAHLLVRMFSKQVSEVTFTAENCVYIIHMYTHTLHTDTHMYTYMIIFYF